MKERTAQLGGYDLPLRFQRVSQGVFRSTCGHFSIVKYVRGGYLGGPRWKVETTNGLPIMTRSGNILTDSTTLIDAVRDLNCVIAAHLSDGFGYLARWIAEEKRHDIERNDRLNRAKLVVDLLHQIGVRGLTSTEGAAELARIYRGCS